MAFITLDQANVMTAAAMAKGKEMGINPLTVAVVDQAGSIIALQRSDRSPSFRPGVAAGKASGAIGMGFNSRTLGEMAVDRPHFISAVAGSTPQALIPVAGGVIILDASGDRIGAIGVSGDTSDNDELCAIAGIEAAGLKASAR